jgi:hypothetical protein
MTTKNKEPGALWANKGTGTENRESTTIHPLTRSPVHPFTLSGEERHR